MRSKEEAEAMAEAILAAHRTDAGKGRVRATRRVGALTPGGDPTRPSPARYIVVAGCLIGIIVGALPSHGWLIGGLTGLLIAVCMAVIVGRIQR